MSRAVALLVIILALTLIAAPLLLLAKTGLFKDGSVSFELLAQTVSSRSVQRALWNSLESSLLSAVFATLIGAGAALAIGLTDVRMKGALVFLLLAPMMVPPHVTAIAWIQALGPGSPVLKPLGLAPALGAPHPLYGRFGVVLLLSIQHAPLVFLTVRAALRSVPAEMSDAARLAGARPLAALRRVLAPLLAPALVAGAALAFVSALGNFGAPALLGLPGKYQTAPVLIWSRLASFGPSVLGKVAALSFLIGILAIVAVALQGLALRALRAPLIGPPQAPLAYRLGRARPAVEAVLWLFLFMVLALPLTAMIAVALSPTYGVDLSLETVTFANFREVLFEQSATRRAFLNSTLIAGAAAALLALLAILIGFAGRLGRAADRRLAGSVRWLSEVSYAIPGLVVSIAFILAFLRPLPVVNIALYNTVWIILLAYLAAFLAIALKPVDAATAQLDPNLDAAARLAGAGYGARLWRIYAPLAAPAAASGAVLVFLTAYNEVTVSALLWSAGAETIGAQIFNYEDGGYTTLAAAMSTVTVIVTVFLMLALHWFGRRLPAGVIPWRA
ncbi:MAG: iron ABC transporter permease [Neomegalonema sp.]|nr:iron ABC transporter permease [Neomegalonema sp.]